MKVPFADTYMGRPPEGVLVVLEAIDPGLEMPIKDAQTFLDQPDRVELVLNRNVVFIAKSPDAVEFQKGGVDVEGSLVLVDEQSTKHIEPAKLALRQKNKFVAWYDRVARGDNEECLHVRLLCD